MIVKFFNEEGEQRLKSEVDIQTATMYLSTKSIYIDFALHDVIESTLSIEDNEIQIVIKER